jgi:uncharacterized protein YbjQ (UPF0145 family)
VLEAQLTKDAKSIDADAVMNFKYGQKGTLFTWDMTSLFCVGVAVKLH